MKEFIQSQIARGNRNLLTIGLLLTVIGVGLATLFSHWFPVLIAIPGVIVLVFWLMRVINPDGHPVYKRLARYGDPRQMAQQVNQEFAGVSVDGTAKFSPNWLAQRWVYGVFLVQWPDVAWLHLYTHISNGVHSNYVRVWTRDGKQFVAPAGVRPGEAEQLLANLYARAPWAEVGYSPELLKQWNKRRTEFLQRVDARMKPNDARVRGAGA
jgi:hypothetical protein